MLWKRFKKFIWTGCLVGLVLGSGTMAFVYSNYENQIEPHTFKHNEKVCAVIFGAAVWRNNQPSHALRDRLYAGIQLYNSGPVNCLILSGGASASGSHDEVSVMKKIALKKGINSEDLILDFDGVNTLSTIKNLPDNVDHFVFVSNDFHLARIKLFALKYGVKSFDLQASPYLSGRYGKEVYFFLREIGGIFWYFKFEMLSLVLLFFFFKQKLYLNLKKNGYIFLKKIIYKQ